MLEDNNLLTMDAQTLAMKLIDERVGLIFLRTHVRRYTRPYTGIDSARVR